MNAEFQHDVFLSHSSKDKAVVRPLAERLRQDGRLSTSELQSSAFCVNPFLSAPPNHEPCFLPLRLRQVEPDWDRREDPPSTLVDFQWPLIGDGGIISAFLVFTMEYQGVTDAAGEQANAQSGNPHELSGRRGSRR